MQLVHAAGGSIGEISTSAREQTMCLSQVSEAVSLLDQMTQQNAALVEAFRLSSGNAPPR